MDETVSCTYDSSFQIRISISHLRTIEFYSKQDNFYVTWARFPATLNDRLACKRHNLIEKGVSVHWSSNESLNSGPQNEHKGCLLLQVFVIIIINGLHYRFHFQWSAIVDTCLQSVRTIFNSQRNQFKVKFLAGFSVYKLNVMTVIVENLRRLESDWLWLCWLLLYWLRLIDCYWQLWLRSHFIDTDLLWLIHYDYIDNRCNDSD